MRKKSENEARNRYARRYAAVLAVEALIQHRGKNVETIIVVEAEDNPLGDDIRQIDAKTGKERRHQVKRQQTPLTEDGLRCNKLTRRSARASSTSAQYKS